MVKFDPEFHHRRSIRLKGYDYAQAGAYFVTIVTWHRECLFGEIQNGEMKLNKIGEIVQREWLNLPERLPYVELGASVVMPNHFHGILFIDEPVGATRLDKIKGQAKNPEGSPLPHGPKPASLGAIIAQFKSDATKRIWKIAEYTNTSIWQRNYYEHIIRDETDLKNKTDYIRANPMLWDGDDENPAKVEATH
jgi:putative transposase